MRSHSEGEDGPALSSFCGHLLPAVRNHGFDDSMHKVNSENVEENSWSSADSGKWLVSLPERKIVQCEEREYYDGEE